MNDSTRMPSNGRSAAPKFRAGASPIRSRPMTGWRGQQRSLLVGQPLVWGAHDADRQARGVRLLLELERVPGGDRRGDPGGVGWHVQETAPPGDQMRVDGRGHDPATVSRAVGRHQERVVEHERVRSWLAVQRRVPEGAWVDGVHGLAQVEVEVLGRSASMPVKGDRRHGPGHERDADAGPEPVCGRHDRILPGEGDGGSGLRPGETDVRQQVVEGFERIERGRFEVVRCGGEGRVADRSAASLIVAVIGNGLPRRER